jgi:Ulp1 family protease
MVSFTIPYSLTLLTSNREAMPAVITSIHCPQQTNSYDCGVYVLLYALRIAQLLLSFLPHQQQAQSLSPLLIQQSVSSITPQDCSEYRTQILTAILPEALEQVKKLQRKR